jgi:putative transposase
MSEETETSQYLSQRFQIYPTKEQEEVLLALGEQCRLMYNFTLLKKRRIWEAIKEFPEDKRTKKDPSLWDWNNSLPQLKKNFPDYQIIHSKVCQNIMARIDTEYKSFFGKWQAGDVTARPPSLRAKDSVFTMRYTQSGFYFRDDQLQLSHKHLSKVKLHFNIGRPHRVKRIGNQTYILDPYITKPKGLDIKRDVKGRWFVSIRYKFDIPPFENNGKVNAFDLGVSNLFAGVNTDCDTLIIKNRRADKYWKHRIEGKPTKKKDGTKRRPGIMFMRDHCFGANRRKKNKNKEVNEKKKKANKKKKTTNKKSKNGKNNGSKKGNGNKNYTPLKADRKSNKYKKYDKRLKKMHYKMSCQMKDHQHKMSKFLVQFCPESILVVGDLDIKNMARKKGGTGSAKQNAINETLNHSSHNSGSLGRTPRMVHYKARLVGKRVVEVSERGSTMTCCICGRKKKRDTTERTIICECGCGIDRDLNGAVWILMEFINNRKDYCEMKTPTGKLKYPFLTKQPSRDEVAFLDRWARYRKTALSASSRDSGLDIIPKNFKNG